MLLFYLFLSVGVSFLCSLFEAVILSISPAYVSSIAESGKSSGQLLHRVKTNIDDSLAAILTLNTISHTIGAAGVGAEVLKLYGNDYVAIASAILTLIILVISEIIPKTIGATYSKQLAGITAQGIQIFIIITWPFVKSFKYLAKLIGSEGHGGKVTRDEVVFTAKLGQKEGILSEDEAVIISNLLRLRKTLVTDVMTPRTVVFSLQEDLTVEEVSSTHSTINFSRIPIYKDNTDDITGVVLRYDLTNAMANDQPETTLKELAKPLHIIPNTMSLGRVFDQFVKRKEHLFAVFDEHGGLNGVISLEDVIETLLGVEITDEFDSVDDMRDYAKKQWEKRQSAPIKSSE